VEEELRDRWAADAGRGRAATAALDSLLGRYREPHRRYHGTAHVLRVLRTVEEILAVTPVADPAAVRLAAWYHDAIYDPRAGAGANEVASAALAERDLTGLEMAPERIAAVARLVLATVTHEPGSADEEVLCDADLAVLAAPPDAYAGYASAVRAEYAHLSDAEFTAGRIAVLERLLALPALYRLPEDDERWTATARANLTAELSLLRARAASASAGPPPGDGPAAPGS